MSGEREFDLFNHHFESGRLYDSHGIIARQIWSRLQKLQRHQESAMDEELYNEFVVSPPEDLNEDIPVVTVEDVVTHDIAFSVAYFFHQEAAAGRRWKYLTLIPFVAMEQLGSILEGARSSNLFSSCRICPDYDVEPNDHHQQSEERILQQFCRGNSSLEELQWERQEFSPATLRSLDEVLHDDSCGIKHLTLRSDRFPVGLPLLNALQGCQSLETLRLGRTIILDQGYRILNLVSTCPRLRAIDLSRDDDINGESFWSRLLPTQDQQCSLESRKRLYRLCLPRNLVRRGYAASDEDHFVLSRSDQEINKLLQIFPALGDFGDEALEAFCSFSVVEFSLRTTQLLAFNYTGRGQLDQSLPPVLWKSVLQRLVTGVCNGALFLQREELMDQKRTLVLSCQASVLFSLLKQDPIVVTAEACRAQPPSTSLLSVMDLL